jgi:glucose 1-dehydrogenase
MDRPLNGSVAIVTGADSGIGQAAAIALAGAGAAVLIHFHEDEKGAQATLDRVGRENSRGMLVSGNLEEPSAVDRIFDACNEGLGIPDILVNNAGIAGIGKKVCEMELEEWDRTQSINLRAPFLMCRRFIAEHRKKRSPGRIINITSIHEDVPRAGAGDYCASKGGLRNLTRCLALELAEENITVNNVAPGMILTPMNEEALKNPAKRRESESHILLGRAGEPQEVASLILFLASPASAYCSGSTYFIDGALMMNWAQGA